jgi:glycosyltransferase involved in cell wall biosynthesis
MSCFAWPFSEGLRMQTTVPPSEERSARRIAAGRLACDGHLARARRELCALAQSAGTDFERANLLSDLAALSAATGHDSAARAAWRRILNRSPKHESAQTNLATLDSRRQPAPQTSRNAVPPSGLVVEPDQKRSRTRIAILSLLFNWPSTGGGTIHTKELAEFLQRDGYDVLHVYAVHEPWGLGQVTQTLSVPTAPLHFGSDEWEAESIQDRFRATVDDFAPDFAILADSWNFKPILAEAIADYPYFLRMAALECLCPLNNVRLLWDRTRGFQQCAQHQLASPDLCRTCVTQNGRYSGSLHTGERALAGFDQHDYAERLRRAFHGAEAVLVVNPQTAELIRPYCRDVRVVPSGFDPKRFPAPTEANAREGDGTPPTRFLFAGLVAEAMKGFKVLWEACKNLWRTRHDFELHVTSNPDSEWNGPFVRWVGWQSQTELPLRMREADVVVFPTIAQEALGRTAVEAMGSGKPVVASRLGGLPWVVEDGVTGLLVEPGDPKDLAAKLGRLLDHPEMGVRYGQAGREKFQREFTWDRILERHYRPLLGAAVRSSSGSQQETLA